MKSKRDKVSTRDKYLLRTYGITEDQYKVILKKQKFRCAICGKHQDDEKVSLSVDHDHVTLEIRGLLCGWCNRRLVGRHRNADLFEAAAHYLRQGTGLYAPANRKRKRRKKK